MEGLGSLLIFAGLFYLMMRFGCGAHMVHGGHGKHGEHDGHGGSDVTHVDPVCGTEVDPQEGYGKMYQRELYRFCSRNCLDKFEAEPDKFLRKVRAEEVGGES
jgi:YHS domain-containing protein